MNHRQEDRDMAAQEKSSETKYSTELDFIFKRQLFWNPSYLAQSTWLEHIPFAFWLVDALQPRKIVELGTHYGSSYFSFCQAVAKLELDTQCFAIDTWSGDKHVSTDSEEIYTQVAEYNQLNYFSFSTLIRSTFDQALEHFEEGSIDLLHIDGLHTLDAVRHDFESWLPKLSPSAVVIMHDTNVRKRGFGVFQFFNELKRHYPHCEFSHGHGLGVVGIGNKQHASMQALYALSSKPFALQQVKEIFSHLGKACSDSQAKSELKQEMDRQAREYKETWQYEQEQHALERGRIAARDNSQHQEREQLLQQISALTEHHSALEASIAERFHELAAMTRHTEILTRELENKEHQLQQAKERAQRLKETVSWKLTAPVRAIARTFKDKGEPNTGTMNAIERIANSGLFDEHWYREHYPEVANSSLSAIEHYLELGAEQGYNPSQVFDTRWYINTYPDVAQCAINPLIHYIMHGQAELRHCLPTN